MTDLRLVLPRLGLGQYVEIFVEEGFETWDTVLDITESDLDALGVKLGHRRVLQKEIGLSRGLSVEQLSSPSTSLLAEGRSFILDESKDNRGPGTGGKRKYRRHPKPDDSAPERPPSAYVIFSNRIREELKPQNLSFTDIAKRVGENWQLLSPAEKEPYETQASTAKETYHTKMASYKITEPYREYNHYLADFKAKNNNDGKRPKLDHDAGNADSTDIGSQADGYMEARHRRVDSTSSIGPYSSVTGQPSPASVTGKPPGLRGGLATTLPLGNASPISTSPTSPLLSRDSTINQFFTGTRQTRSSVQPYQDRIFSHAAAAHHIPCRNSSESQDSQTPQGTNSGLRIDPRLSHGQTSPTQGHRGSRISPSWLQHTTSDSSKSSTTSNLSGESTAASSIEDGGRTQISLPPLSSVGLDLRSATSSTSRFAGATASTYAPNQPSQTPFESSSSSGMKFESLQLPLPYNISFGQHPLPRSDNDVRIANIFDLQDLPRERSSLRNLSLQPGDDSQNLRGPLPEHRHPPHRPVLPTLQRNASLSCDDIRDSPSNPNVDALLLLASAGRIVDRESQDSQSS